VLACKVSLVAWHIANVTAGHRVNRGNPPRDVITTSAKERVVLDIAGREQRKRQRKRVRAIRTMRVKHSAATQLRSVIDKVCRDLARSPVAYDEIADLLVQIADELRAKASSRHELVAREVDRVRPMLAKANVLAKRKLSASEIDRRLGLTSWLDEVDADVSVREIIERITRPKRHEFMVDAYWLVGKIRDVSMEWQSVKRIYGQQRRAGR
jgi:hypothetical protein